MLPTKYLCTAAVLALTALSFGQDKIKIESKWDKETKVKLKHKFEIELDGHHAQITGQTLWTGEMADDGYTLTVHHDSLEILADDNEVSPPYEDYKIGISKKSGLTSFSGGIDGSDPLRMFLVGHFFVPSTELAKDTVTKWEIPADSKVQLGALKIETTFLGDAEVGKTKGFKFKQVVSEDKGNYGTEGTYVVTATGHVLKADVTFKGMPIPAAGGDAKGKFTSSVIE